MQHCGVELKWEVADQGTHKGQKENIFDNFSLETLFSFLLRPDNMKCFSFLLFLSFS